MQKTSKIWTLIVLSVLFFLLNGLCPLYSQEINPQLFKRSEMVSAEAAREQVKQIYFAGGHTKTLHCGCYFDKQSQVYPGMCDHAPRTSPLQKRVRKILGWARAVPISSFAELLKCWSKPVCIRPNGETYRGVGCCRVISPRFKSMEADMHNLFPAFSGDDPDLDETSGEAQFGGMKEYGFCPAKKESPLEPRPGARGDIARAYFYMSYLYKIPIADELEDKLRMWHLKDPPDKWEEDKNSVIEIVQGNRNPFIDQPELVARVKDF